jgi:hypothetical protein
LILLPGSIDVFMLETYHQFVRAWSFDLVSVISYSKAYVLPQAGRQADRQADRQTGRQAGSQRRVKLDEKTDVLRRRYRDGLMDGQTDKQADRQRDKKTMVEQTGECAERKIERGTDRWPNLQTGWWTERQKDDGGTDRQMCLEEDRDWDRQMAKFTNRLMDREAERQMDKQTDECAERMTDMDWQVRKTSKEIVREKQKEGGP